MYELLIFGGTSEGRILAEYCAEKHIHAYVSVTTEYGSELIAKSDFLRIITGRLDSSQIAEFITLHNIKTVIDATHPYAQEITKNIKSACEIVTYFRVVRETTYNIPNAEYFESIAKLIDFLNSNDGNVLITTGSKNINEFCGVEDYAKRCTVRVLPSDNIAGHCVELGFDKSKIISEKGPFTEEQNIQHIKKSNASFLVTKDSGITGGFAEKLCAAEKCGTVPLILKRPEEKGVSLEAMKKILGEEYCE